MPREEKGTPMGSVNNAPSSGSGGESGSSLAARRARLRGSLSRASLAPDEPMIDTTETLSEPVPSVQDKPAPSVAASPQPHQTNFSQALTNSSAQFDHVGPGVKASAAPAAHPTAGSASVQEAHAPVITPVKTASAPQPLTPTPTVPSTIPATLPTIPGDVNEYLLSIDSALNACATNLAALQRLAGEQTEVLKVLSSTLQNQTLFEIGLNLNSLTESLSAALEPMKAMGELVPALDQLVNVMEGREPAIVKERLAPDALVTGLADQLSAGLIDPWTFKCAYMAIYPSEHPADLLHRLVELLGTQRLSGDLFRAAYEAVQGAEPPSQPLVRPSVPLPGAAPAAGTAGGAPELGQRAPELVSEEILQQIEELQRANDELRGRQEQREHELQHLLRQKEAELQDAQIMLNSRYDEFNSRYEEVADALNKREDEYRTLLENKDMELVEKESELNLLRAQMEELRNQTEEMVKDLQKQLADMRTSGQDMPKPQSNSFFDSAPSQPPRNVFEPQQPKPLFEQQQQAQSAGGLPVHPQQQMQQAPAQPAMQQATSQQMPMMQQQQQMQQTSSQQMAMVNQPSTGNVAAAPMAASAQQQPPGGQQPARDQRPAAAPAQPAPTTPFSPGPGSYGSGVRAQVFEVIVRQALAGAPWREICAGPMKVNNISPEEVEAEVKRRQALLNK